MYLRCLGVVSAAVLLLAVATQGKDSSQEWKPSDEAHRATGSQNASGKPSGPLISQPTDIKIEAVVVTPYRSANVGGQVGGEIEKFHFEEGDPLTEGEVVVEIDPTRYRLLVQRTEEKLRGIEAVLRRAEEEAQIKQQLFELDSTSLQEVTRTKAEAEVALHRVAETRVELELARLDLDGTKIKAPFSGYLTIRYKQPDEPVERLEKIFGVVDSSKVHAVANVPENLLSEFRKGTQSVFVHGKGKSLQE